MANSYVYLTSGTYDFKGSENGYGIYLLDATDGNLTIQNAQAFGGGLNYIIMRIDNSSNTITFNAYPGDVMNGSLTSLLIPPLSQITLQTYTENIWIVPILSYSTGALEQQKNLLIKNANPINTDSKKKIFKKSGR